MIPWWAVKYPLFPRRFVSWVVLKGLALRQNLWASVSAIPKLDGFCRFEMQETWAPAVRLLDPTTQVAFPSSDMKPERAAEEP